MKSSQEPYTTHSPVETPKTQVASRSSREIFPASGNPDNLICPFDPALIAAFICRQPSWPQWDLSGIVTIHSARCRPVLSSILPPSY